MNIIIDILIAGALVATAMGISEWHQSRGLGKMELDYWKTYDAWMRSGWIGPEPVMPDELRRKYGMSVQDDQKR